MWTKIRILQVMLMFVSDMSKAVGYALYALYVADILCDIRQHNFFINRERFEDRIYFAFCHDIDNRHHQKAARKFIDKLFDYA